MKQKKICWYLVWTPSYPISWMISLKNLSQYLASENLYITDVFFKFSKINIKHLDESISCISWCGWAFDICTAFWPVERLKAFGYCLLYFPMSSLLTERWAYFMSLWAHCSLNGEFVNFFHLIMSELNSSLFNEIVKFFAIECRLKVYTHTRTNFFFDNSSFWVRKWV